MHCRHVKAAPQHCGMVNEARAHLSDAAAPQEIREDGIQSATHPRTHKPPTHPHNARTRASKASTAKQANILQAPCLSTPCKLLQCCSSCALASLARGCRTHAGHMRDSALMITTHTTAKPASLHQDTTCRTAMARSARAAPHLAKQRTQQVQHR